MAVLAEHGVHDACNLRADTLPPVGAELCTKVADHIVVEALLHLEKEAAMLLLRDFDRFYVLL